MENQLTLEGLSQYSAMYSSGNKKTRMKWSTSMPLRRTSMAVMKHRVLTFSWCKISLKLTNCREIFWFLNRLYWMRNCSVEKFSAGSIANWVDSWWADHVTAGEGWRHVRVKPPALEQPLIKYHLPGAGSWTRITVFGTLGVSRWPCIRRWLWRVDTTLVVIKASRSSHCRDWQVRTSSPGAGVSS